MDRPGVPELHRAALAAALGGTLPAASPADTAPDSPADTAPAAGAASKRTPRRTGTAAAVARLRDRHPDMSAADIARRLGVTDRTVRRHLSARTIITDAPPAVAA